MSMSPSLSTSPSESSSDMVVRVIEQTYDACMSNYVLELSTNFSRIPIIFTKPCGYHFVRVFHNLETVADLYRQVNLHLLESPEPSHIKIFAKPIFKYTQIITQQYHASHTIKSICKEFSLTPVWDVPDRIVYRLWVIDW